MVSKDLLRMGVRVLNTDWGIANNFKNPIVKFLQRKITSGFKNFKNPYIPIQLESILVEVTTRCNSKCIFCPHGVGSITRRIETMSNEFFFRIVDICKRENINAIMFGGLGDPLCDKDFLTKANYVVKSGTTLDCLTTNAMLLDEDISKSLFNLNLKCINFSIDSMDKSKYENIRNGLSFDTVINNILYFLELNLKNGRRIDVTITSTTYKDNLGEKPQFINRFNKYFGSNFKLTFNPVHNWGGELSGQLDKWFTLKFDRLRTYCRRVFDTSATIRVDGSLSLCCLDYNNKYPIGIVEDSILKLWNSSKILDIRIKHSEGNWDDISLCVNCSDIILGRPPTEIVEKA